jgi:prepilin-type N-terminal cleavage/methylation domain-containing protein
MKKLVKNKKNLNRGVTLIEIIVVIFVIVLFSSIIVTNFPQIMMQFALSRVTYKLSQDLRRAQDLGLSGVKTQDINGDYISAKGYGIYMDLNDSSVRYMLYADVNNNQKFDNVGDHNCSIGGVSYSYNCCDKDTTGSLTTDCVIDIIDISQQNSKLYIEGVKNNGSEISDPIININFKPPKPVINITDGSDNDYSEIEIVIAGSTYRMVKINTSGLINVE